MKFLGKAPSEQWAPNFSASTIGAVERFVRANPILEISITRTVEPDGPDAFFRPVYKVNFGPDVAIFKTLDAAEKWIFSMCEMHDKDSTMEPSAPKQYKRKLLL